MREPMAGDVYFHEDSGCIMIIYESATLQTLTTMWLNGFGPKNSKACPALTNPSNIEEVLNTHTYVCNLGNAFRDVDEAIRKLVGHTCRST